MSSVDSSNKSFEAENHGDTDANLLTHWAGQESLQATRFLKQEITALDYQTFQLFALEIAWPKKVCKQQQLSMLKIIALAFQKCR